MAWKRPSHVQHPSVWLKFEGKKPMLNGKIPKFKVQDLTDDMKEDVLALMMDIFTRDEVTCKRTKLRECPESMALLKEDWQQCFEDNVALVCLLDEDLRPGEKPVIVGANVTIISHKIKEKSPLRNEPHAYRNSAGTVTLVTNKVDIFKTYGVDQYLSAFGLVIRSEFRGQNIGAEILRARIPLCKAIGIDITATVFTGVASQTVAAKAGFKTIAEVTYKDMVEKEGFDLENITETSSKLMLLDVRNITWPAPV